MARTAKSYQDNKGAFYTTPEEAARADIAAVLGRIGGGTGLAEGLSKQLLDQRNELRKCFDEYDQMLEQPASKPARLKAVGKP